MATASFPHHPFPYFPSICPYPPPAAAYAPPPGFFQASAYGLTTWPPPAPDPYSSTAVDSARFFQPPPAETVTTALRRSPEQGPSAPLPESPSPSLLTTASKMQADPASVLKLHDPNGACSSSRHPRRLASPADDRLPRAPHPRRPEHPAAPQAQAPRRSSALRLHDDLLCGPSSDEQPPELRLELVPAAIRPRRPPPSSPPPLAASMAAVAPAWPLSSGPPSSSLRPSRMPSYARLLAPAMEPVLGRPSLECLHANVVDRTTEVTTTTSTSVSFGSSASSTTTAGSTTTRTVSSWLFSAPSISPSAASAYAAPQVFDESPIPRPWQEKHGTDPESCSGQHNPIHSSGVSKLNEQNRDGMPQPYGFHNLNRRSVFLSDGTEHSFYALPENYPLEGATPGLVFDACADETDGCSTEFVDVLAGLPEQHTYEHEQHESAQLTKCSKANNTASFESMLVHSLQVPTTMQDASSVFKEKPVYDVYEDVTDCQSCLHPTVDITEVDTEEVDVKVDSGKPIISPKRSSDGIFSLTNEKKSDTDLLVVCLNNALDNTISKEATDFTFPHGPIHADRSIKLPNEKSTQAASILSVHEAVVHCHDERSVINIKKQDMLINKHNITSSCDLNNDKEVPFVLHYQLPLSSTPCIWDPGIDLFSYKKMHLVSWIPHSAILLPQQLHNKIISSMWDFSLGKGRQVQWDPGIKLLLYELWWLQSLSKRTEYALGHLLSVKFFIETAAIMCCSLPKLIQQRRNVAVVLYSWRSIFHDMHYRQICQKCKAMSSQLYWHEDIKFNGIALWLINFNPP